MKRKLFLIILTLISFSVYAEVEEWSAGTCWLEKIERPNEEVIFKLASFNDHVATEFNPSELVQVSSLKLANKRLELVDINFHCGSYGHSVILVLKENEGLYCSWVYEKNREWTVRSLGLVAGKGDMKHCHGYALDSFLVIANRESDGGEVQRVLKTDYAREIKNVIKVTSRVFKVELNARENFEEVKESLLKRSDLQPLIKIELNSYSHPIGEFKE